MHGPPSAHPTGSTEPRSTPKPAFIDSFPTLDGCQDAVQLIRQAIVDDPPATLSTGGAIRPGFSAELDNLLVAVRDAKEWIANLERLIDEGLLPRKANERSYAREVEADFERIWASKSKLGGDRAARASPPQGR